MKEPRVPRGSLLLGRTSRLCRQRRNSFIDPSRHFTCCLHVANLQPAIATRMLFRIMHSTAKQLLWASAVLVDDRDDNLRWWRRQRRNDRTLRAVGGRSAAGPSRSRHLAIANCCIAIGSPSI